LHEHNDLTTPVGDHGPAPYPTVLPGTAGWNDNARRSYAAYLTALWDEQTQYLRPLHLAWQQNLLFLVGQHWHRLGRDGFRVDRTDPLWKLKPTYNLCLPFYNTYLAKVTKTRPATQVVPASSDPKDMKAAQLGDDLIEAKWTELKAARRYRHFCGWTILTGNGYALPFWNPRAGRIKRLEAEMECPVYEADGVTPLLVESEDEPGMLVPATEILTVPYDAEGEPMLGEDGRPRPGAKAHVVEEGEVDFRVYSPFQVRVNPEATCDEDVTWFIVTEPMSLREIAKRWPEAAAKVQAEDLSTVMGILSTLSGMLDGRLSDGSEFGVSPRDERQKSLPRALVKFYYERQCADYPEGRHWVSVGDVLLEEPQDLPDGLFRLIHTQDIIVPGRYHGMSKLEAAVAINREYNELSARIAEHHRLFANGKYAVPNQAGVKKGTFTTEPGEVVRYTYPYKPEPMPVPALPASVYQERERLLVDFERVTGMRAVSQGGTTGGVTAGIAIMQLQEADDADLGPFLASAEEAVADLAGAWLILIKNNYTDERLYYAAGPDRRYMVQSFRASDLEGAVDVIPQAGSSRPGSEVARQAVIMDLAQRFPVLFNDPETGRPDPARFARALQLGGLEAAYESEDGDVAEAMRIEEQISLLGGMDGMDDSTELVMPQPWQNLAVHYRQHRRTLAGAEWKEWPEEAQMVLQQRFLAVKAAIDQQRVQDAMLLAGGAPGGMPQEGGEPAAGPMGGMGAAMDPLGAEADMMEQGLEDAAGGGLLN